MSRKFLIYDRDMVLHGLTFQMRRLILQNTRRFAFPQRADIPGEDDIGSTKMA